MGLILTDRSRIQAYLDCQRFRFLRYHFFDEEGVARGLEAVERSLPQLNGTFVHQALELVLTGEDLEAALVQAKGAYLASMLGKGDPAFINEQLCLLEGLVRAWVRVRLPEILLEYEVVSVEEEHRWPLDSQIIDMVRCDVVLRRKRDGLLFILEFKTTGMASEDWALQWEHNSQVLANTLAMEEIMGEPIAGMLIEGLVKGRLAKDTGKRSPFYGKVIQQSPLCYAYEDPDTGTLRSSYTYGWTKVRVWERTTPKAWVEEAAESELRPLFKTAGPFAPNRLELRSWKHQTIKQEYRVASKVILMQDVWNSEPCEDDLDELFPKNHQQCRRYYGHPCSFEGLCFNGEVARDPIGSGLYRIRIPHHNEEEVTT